MDVGGVAVVGAMTGSEGGLASGCTTFISGSSGIGSGTGVGSGAGVGSGTISGGTYLVSGGGSSNGSWASALSGGLALGCSSGVAGCSAGGNGEAFSFGFLVRFRPYWLSGLFMVFLFLLLYKLALLALIYLN
jgi:hypothetical protein